MELYTVCHRLGSFGVDNRLGVISDHASPPRITAANSDTKQIGVENRLQNAGTAYRSTPQTSNRNCAEGDFRSHRVLRVPRVPAGPVELFGEVLYHPPLAMEHAACWKHQIHTIKAVLNV